LFQQNKPDNLNEILKQELEYFQSILQFSEKFVNQIQTLSINVLAEMMNYRQQLLDKIRQLEEKRKLHWPDADDDSAKNYLHRISEVAGNLVEIDNRIYENLQNRKMEYARQMSDNANGQAYLEKDRKLNSIDRRFDTYQE